MRYDTGGGAQVATVLAARTARSKTMPVAGAVGRGEPAARDPDRVGDRPEVGERAAVDVLEDVSVRQAAQRLAGELQHAVAGSLTAQADLSSRRARTAASDRPRRSASSSGVAQSSIRVRAFGSAPCASSSWIASRSSVAAA